MENIQYMINDNGEKTAVVIPLSLWKEIQEDLLGYSSEEETKEISADAALMKAIDSYRKQKEKDGLSSEDVLKRLVTTYNSPLSVT